MTHTGNLFIVVLLATSAVFISAQSPRKLKPSDSEDALKSSRLQDQRKSAAQSPFTRPADIQSRQLPTRSLVATEPSTAATTTTTTTTTAPPAALVVDTKIVQAVQEKQAVSVGSPFSPPAKSEWRLSPPGAAVPKKPARQMTGKNSPWLDSVEERQRENINSIPPLAKIDITEDSDTKKRFKPKTSAYHEKGHKDMHDSEPGVTPWTRYTDKPRLKEELSSSGKANARCGRYRYNPRSQICCQGKVARRHGISPACCQGESYDTVFNKCCNGAISVRTNGQADC